jgi:hypothetical protein
MKKVLHRVCKTFLAFKNQFKERKHSVRNILYKSNFKRREPFVRALYFAMNEFK